MTLLEFVELMIDHRKPDIESSGLLGVSKWRLGHNLYVKVLRAARKSYPLKVPAKGGMSYHIKLIPNRPVNIVISNSQF